VGKAFEKGPRGGKRRRETNNTEINLRKKYCEYSKWKKLAQHRVSFVAAVTDTHSI
jgi:hypothetical protein